jgi:hypothetical protein
LEILYLTGHSLTIRCSERSAIGNYPLLGGAKLRNGCAINDQGWVSSHKRKFDNSSER